MLLFLPIILFPYALQSCLLYAFEVNLFFSNYAEKIFSTQTKHLIFYCTASHTALDVP